MKKTLKRILCVLIVTVMAISPTSAFAFQSDGTEYVYGGELTEGMNYFFENTTWEERYDEIDFYCTFTAEFDGYYGFGFGHMHCYIEGDVYADDGTGTKQEYEHQYYDDEYYHETRLYYLTAGEYYFAGKSDSKIDTHLYFESLGEEMTAVSFDRELMYGYDFFEVCDDDNGVYTETRTDIVFSSGESFTIGRPRISGKLESDFKEGKNNITFEFLDKSLPSIATIYKVSHFVADAEISNVEKYLDCVAVYYNGCDYVFPDGETLTVTFTDGTTNSSKINPSWYGDYVLFPNGEGYYCDIYFDFYGLNNVDLVISFDEAEVKRYECKIKRATVAENAELFIENCKTYIEESSDIFDYAIESFDRNNILESTKNSFEYAIMAFLRLFEIQIDIYDFIFFYLGITY